MICAPALRTRVTQLATTDWRSAATLAHTIEDPWYAAQALAWCGRFASPSTESRALLTAAISRGDQGKDAYQRLASRAWPLRAWIETDAADVAAVEFRRAASLAASVTPPSSRAEACFLVFEAMAVAPCDAAIMAFDWLLAELKPDGYWRERRAIREATLIAVTRGLIDRDEVACRIADARLVENILMRSAAGSRHEPRRFFWPDH